MTMYFSGAALAPTGCCDWPSCYDERTQLCLDTCLKTWSQVTTHMTSRVACLHVCDAVPLPAAPHVLLLRLHLPLRLAACPVLPWRRRAHRGGGVAGSHRVPERGNRTKMSSVRSVHRFLRILYSFKIIYFVVLRSERPFMPWGTLRIVTREQEFADQEKISELIEFHISSTFHVNEVLWSIWNCSYISYVAAYIINKTDEVLRICRLQYWGR